MLKAPILTKSVYVNLRAAQHHKYNRLDKHLFSGIEQQ